MESDSSYLSELLAEKDSLDPAFVHSMRLLTTEINRIQSGGNPLVSPKLEQDEASKNGTSSEHEGGLSGSKSPGEGLPRRESRPYRKPIDPFDSKLYQPIKLTEKVFIPTKEYPKFNFVGKLLGPRGNTFKRLQQNTGTKMSILGRGSMRDKEKEEELRGSDDTKYAHLSEDLHVFIEVEAPPGQAHARLGIAIEELKKFLVPELNDEIHQEQMREMAILNSGADELVPGGQAPIAMQGGYVRGRTRGRGMVAVGRPAGVGRSVLAGSVRTHRLQPQRAHLQVGVSAARSAAGLPRSPTVAHAAPRTVQPQVGDPYAGFDTYEGIEYEAAYPAESGDTLYYADYGQVAENEAYETTYPPPARIVSAASTYKSAPSRPMKKAFREASQPY